MHNGCRPAIVVDVSVQKDWAEQDQSRQVQRKVPKDATEDPLLFWCIGKLWRRSLLPQFRCRVSLPPRKAALRETFAFLQMEPRVHSDETYRNVS